MNEAAAKQKKQDPKYNDNGNVFQRVRVQR
jgi:hypothetical protein